MIHAQIICDSISPQGHRLTTFLLRYPKFIHGELMTHRMFSRNASSSRAVPTQKLIDEARSSNRATPVWWGKNQAGMQAEEELDNEALRLHDGLRHLGAITDRQAAQAFWAYAANQAALTAGTLYNLGVHKQIVNRVMEPYLHINTLVTATEYMNFFGLRLDKAAQPEMRELAEDMWSHYNMSKPKVLAPGLWHLPWVDSMTLGDIYTRASKNTADGFPESRNVYDMSLRVSVARCARLSYLSNDTGKRSSIDEDLKLYDRLVGAHPMHASPAEHQATPDENVNMIKTGRGSFWASNNRHEWGNFVGWIQYRKMLQGEACAPLPLDKSSPA